jgi:hypothetical protein
MPCFHETASLKNKNPSAAVTLGDKNVRTVASERDMIWIE